MNDLDSQIRAFVVELLDSAPTAPPFPEVATASPQRPRPPRRRLVLGVIAGVILLAAALVVTANQHHATRVQTNQGPTTTTIATKHGDALSFREVLNTVPYRGHPTPSLSPGAGASGTTSCEGGALVTPRAKQTPIASIVLPDRKRTACYLLGPTSLTGHNISTADAVIDTTTSAWIINVHFTTNDFVTKIAVPYVNKQIAIVLNGIVEAAPTVNPGITGQDVTIAGEYDEATAKRVAASIAPPSPHTSDTTNATDPETAAFLGQCASVAPRLGFNPTITTASEIRAADARAGLVRANISVPSALATIDGKQLLALCEFTATHSGLTPTSICANGTTINVGPLIFYAVDAHLNATRLPGVQYLFPLPPGATPNPQPNLCQIASP